MTAGSTAAQAARQATATIPIVMASGNPVELGLVTSLARPGGNITGVTTLSIELAAKRLEMAREVVPAASGFAILGNAGNPNSLSNIREADAAARKSAGRPPSRRHRAGSEDKVDDAFSATLVRERAGVLMVTPSPMFFGGARAPGRARRGSIGSRPCSPRRSTLRPEA